MKSTLGGTTWLVTVGNLRPDNERCPFMPRFIRCNKKKFQNHAPFVLINFIPPEDGMKMEWALQLKWVPKLAVPERSFQW